MKRHIDSIKDEVIFKSLVQAIPDIVYIIDTKGVLTFVNDAVYKLGYEPGELIGKHISLLLHEEDMQGIFRDQVLPAMAGRASDEQDQPKLIDERRTGGRITKNLRIRLVSKDREDRKSGILDAEAVAVGLHDVPGKKEGAGYFGTIGVIKDISDVKRSELTLSKTIRYYEMLIENISNIIVIAALDGTVLYTSPSIEKILGYDKADLIGENKLDFVHPEDRDTIGKLFLDGETKAAAGDYMEFRFSNKQGEWRLFEVITRPTFDEKGNLVCLIFYLNDITKRRIAEEELKRSEKRFRTIVENSRDIIFRYRLAPSQAFDYISPAVEAVTGHTQEEFYRDSGLILKFIDPDDRHLVEGLTTEKLVLNKPFTLRWKLDNGKTICTEQSTIAVSDERGGIVAVEGIARDVTLRMQMEDRLKKSLKEKEVLLTEIHHRVKNNMQIISSLLSIQSQNISDPSIMNLFTDTQNRIHSIALIHNIMYKSKNLGSVDFEEYVQDLASILLRSLAVDREKIKLHIDAIDVRLDINRAIPCGLIINEIVSNSIKHAFPGERTGDVRISFSGEDPDRYTLLVRDNGIGIDGNIDLDRTDSIGLTIVRDLTLQLKGTLGIHNDNGTEIRVEFPKQRNPAE